MATTEEKACHDDSDCSESRYCYHKSKLCVIYTQCNRYNRQENAERKSRHPSQCGSCLPGYTAEELATGETAWLCKKTNAQQDLTETSKLSNSVIVYTTIGMLLISLVSLLVFFVAVGCRKRALRRQGNNSLCVMVPTAPPFETSPFIDSEGASSLVSINNNKNLKDKNNLVRASAYMPPNYVRTNPNYENDVNNDSMDAMEQLQSTIEFPNSEQPNNWVPEQLTLQVANGNLVGYEREPEDNNLSTILIGTNNATAINTNEDETNENSNNNDNGSTSESSNAQSNRERVRMSNILISQKISMNVNLLNDNC